MTFLFLCRQRDLRFSQGSFSRALNRRGVEVACVQDDTRLNEDVLTLAARCGEQPSLIVQPESDFCLLPKGLDKINVPTVCFHFDPYAYLHRRIRWALLFDYAFLFHVGFEDAFRKAGHPNPVTILHAVDAEFFAAPAKERCFDLGWVGRSRGPVYATRRRVLRNLAMTFRMNEWEKFSSYEEMAQIYCASKIVVNVGRDDFPVDVSLRFAEAMAAGALFITMLPSEINQLGFQDGIHFVGVRSEAEIFDRVHYYLEHPAERHLIAETGREKVLREHTYDQRVTQLLEMLELNRNKLYAPARSWSEESVRLVYLDYYSANSRFDHACGELREIVKGDLRSAAAGGTLVARAFLGRVRNQIRSALGSIK